MLNNGRGGEGIRVLEPKVSPWQAFEQRHRGPGGCSWRGPWPLASLKVDSLEQVRLGPSDKALLVC